MHSNDSAGKFISFEGIDGAGKSTAILSLAKYLRNQSVHVYLTREPGGTQLGEKLRELLLQGHALQMEDEVELMLMFAARTQHIREVIMPKLKEGVWVLSDRFVDASFAYQGAGRGIDFARIQSLSDWALNGFYPDLTVIFDLTIEESLKRANNRIMSSVSVSEQGVTSAASGRDRFEKQAIAFKQRVREYYQSLQSTGTREFVHLDAMQPMQQVHENLIEAIHDRWFNHTDARLKSIDADTNIVSE